MMPVWVQTFPQIVNTIVLVHTCKYAGLYDGNIVASGDYIYGV